MRNRPFGDRPDRHCARCSSAAVFRARILFHSARRGVSVRVLLSWFSLGRSPCFRKWQIHLGAMGRRQPSCGKRTARCSTTSRSVNALCLFLLFFFLLKTGFFFWRKVLFYRYPSHKRPSALGSWKSGMKRAQSRSLFASFLFFTDVLWPPYGSWSPQSNAGKNGSPAL